MTNLVDNTQPGIPAGMEIVNPRTYGQKANRVPCCVTTETV